MVYVWSYTQGKSVAEEMNWPFYKATTINKQELFTKWACGRGGWMVAIGALGTGIDIANMVYIVYLGRPYRLTSFMQQTGRERRAGEIGDLIVILPSSGGGHGIFQVPQQELVSMYLVEVQNEAILTKYLESNSCRRAILARHLDGDLEGTNYIATNGILYNQY
jgi:superfamily II DNA helicase RecQ